MHNVGVRQRESYVHVPSSVLVLPEAEVAMVEVHSLSSPLPGVLTSLGQVQQTNFSLSLHSHVFCMVNRIQILKHGCHGSRAHIIICSRVIL